MKTLKLASLALAISFMAFAAQAQSPEPSASPEASRANQDVACASPDAATPSLPGSANENKADPTSQNNPCNPGSQ
jgi:hypothetical protein